MTALVEVASPRPERMSKPQLSQALLHAQLMLIDRADGSRPTAEHGRQILLSCARAVMQLWRDEEDHEREKKVALIGKMRKLRDDLRADKALLARMQAIHDRLPA
ncbi:hypothetical protein [Brytella acorum]|uniref:Uncharacterized protein n=1 Tax=Brytella acorum TaxID=2959299 RepID=A0AA35UU85_9PROT|nr:hypothetical protein [Brytella acorum]CAI9119545.1 hypothetical protein LMG32879_000362 [Brytella acorum]